MSCSVPPPRQVHAASGRRARLACIPRTFRASHSRRLLLSEENANFDELGKAFPDGEYGWAKLMGELQLRAFHKQYGVDAVAARIFTAYGRIESRHRFGDQHTHRTSTVRT